MKLVVGLGNPGGRYEGTRHNVGWCVLDHLATRWRCTPWRLEGEAALCDGQAGSAGARARLMKPLTWMNLTGRALEPYARSLFWDHRSDLLVVVDDVALPVGRFRLRARGSAGGHNGLKSLESTFGSREYARLRVGIGPAGDREVAGDLADFVLAPFEPDERDTVVSLMPRFADAAESWLHDGIEAAMNLHNQNPN